MPIALTVAVLLLVLLVLAHASLLRKEQRVALPARAKVRHPRHR